jgi:hypothetical protein
VEEGASTGTLPRQGKPKWDGLTSVAGSRRREFCPLIYREEFLERNLSKYLENLGFFVCQSGTSRVTSDAVSSLWDSSCYGPCSATPYRS